MGLYARCLALNTSFEPLTLVPVRRALRLVIDGKAEIVEADQGRFICSERLTVPRPAVIRLVRFVHVPRKFRRQVTNTFLFARDGYRCQFCGRSVAELKPRVCLTRDHLVPLSRGGTNEWTNVINACSTCNTRKGNRLPEECGMKLLKLIVFQSIGSSLLKVMEMTTLNFVFTTSMEIIFILTAALSAMRYF